MCYILFFNKIKFFTNIWFSIIYLLNMLLGNVLEKYDYYSNWPLI